MKRMKFAVAGGWHTHAFDFPLDRAPKRCKGLEYTFVGVWDNDAERGKTLADALGVRFFAEYDELISILDLDGVLVTCETSLHEDLIVKAARSGVHVFVEKALTTSAESAYRIRDAVKENEIKLTVSDPVRHGDLLYAKKMIDEGQLGELTFARSRMAHGLALSGQEQIKRFYDADKTGGGAMIDMGYHNVHRLQWFLGKPLRAAAVLAPYTPLGIGKGIDENSVAVFEFEGGKVGVSETGWLTEGTTAFEAYGTKGCIKSDEAGFRYRLEGEKDWTFVPKEEIPEEDIYPLRYWMECIADDKPCEKYDIDTAVGFTEMIMAAMQGNRQTAKVAWNHAEQ